MCYQTNITVTVYALAERINTLTELVETLQSSGKEDSIPPADISAYKLKGKEWLLFANVYRLTYNMNNRKLSFRKCLVSAVVII